MSTHRIAISLAFILTLVFTNAWAKSDFVQSPNNQSKTALQSCRAILTKAKNYLFKPKQELISTDLANTVEGPKKIFDVPSEERIQKQLPISEISTKDLEPVPVSIPHSKNELAEQALEIAPKFIDYFKTINRVLSERKFAIVPVELALLAKAHIIFVGPPGNAKTMLVNGVIKNIKAIFQSKSGETELRPDYFVTQLTKETTLG